MSDWGLESISSNISSNYGENDIMRQLPQWVAFETIEFQIHWQNTAGRRPIQPPDQRQYYEQLYKARNKFFVCNLENETNQSNQSNSSFIQNEYSIMNLRSFGYNGPYGIQITHINILKTHAVYLIKFKTPTYEFCTWHRYTNIKKFYYQIVKFSNKTHFINTKLSWQLWKYRKSWFRNLTPDYLQMKAFLLERLLQDALYESASIELFMKSFSGIVGI